MDLCGLKIFKFFFSSKFISVLTEVDVASIQTYVLYKLQKSREKLLFFPTSQNPLRFVLENLFTKFNFKKEM